MHYKILGKSKLKVSEISLGSMSLDANDKQTAGYILEQLTNLGINYLDTADLYDQGRNEELLGDLLGAHRKDWVLASKVGNRWRKDGSGWDWAPSKSYIIESVEGTLGRLKTDYLDLYQLHGGTTDDPYDEIIEAFERLVEQGKIRYYGLSSIRPNVFLKYAEESAIVSNMMQYSLFDRRPEEYLDEMDSHGIGIIARGSLAQGLLAGKTAKDYLGYSEDLVSEIQQKIKHATSDLGVSSLTFALKYPLLHESVRTSALGIRTREQADSLTNVVAQWDRIHADDYQSIIEALPPIRYDLHRE
ncbi:MAG: aldo/keto reductase [Sphingobacterium sp.]